MNLYRKVPGPISFAVLLGGLAIAITLLLLQRTISIADSFSPKDIYENQNKIDGLNSQKNIPQTNSTKNI